MNPLLRRLLGPYLDTTTGDGNDLGGTDEIIEGSVDDTIEGGAQDTVEGGAPKNGADVLDGKAMEDGMAAAIKQHIAVDGKKTPAAGDDTVTGAAPKKAAPPKGETDEARVAREVKEAEDAEAARAAAATAAKTKEDEARAALAKKSSKDFTLSPEEKKALSSKAQGRFHELHGLLKIREDELAAKTTENAELATARDQILGAMDEYKCDADKLIPLLEYNLALANGDFEGALKMVEEQRAQILRQLGREAPGVDLLKDFPDLAKKVENEELTRDAALEVAGARRKEAKLADERKGAESAAAAEEAEKQKHESALADIGKWCAGLAKTDIDYKTKEGKILPQLKDILAKYPPELWLETIKGRYEAMVVEKSKVIPENRNGLRPSGAKGGGAAPATMEEAIAKGLGYENMNLRA